MLKLTTDQIDQNFRHCSPYISSFWEGFPRNNSLKLSQSFSLEKTVPQGGWLSTLEDALIRSGGGPASKHVVIMCVKFPFLPPEIRDFLFLCRPLVFERNGPVANWQRVVMRYAHHEGLMGSLVLTFISPSTYQLKKLESFFGVIGAYTSEARATG
jgi:hypothetical protein